jgi:uroporphyrinogen-III synthase
LLLFHLQVIAVGPTTAESLKSNGIIPSAVMAKPTPESLIDVLKSMKEKV